MSSQKLTQSLVKSVQSNGRKQRYPDHEVRGLALRVTEKGAKAFVIRYRKPDRSSAEMKVGGADTITLAQARTIARDKLAEVAAGGDPLASKAEMQRQAEANKLKTMEAVVERYFSSNEYESLRPSTRSFYEIHLRVHILPRIGSFPVEELRRRDLVSLRETLLAECSEATVKACLSTLSVLLNFALELELIEFNPAAGMKKKVKSRVRERLLSDAELKTLWTILDAEAGMGASVAAIIRLCMFLPARAGEVSGMRWEELDLEAAVWAIPASRMKAKRDHELPLTASAVSLLRDLSSAASGPWVFPNKDRTGPMGSKVAGRACNRLSKEHGWDSFGPHDLRRSIATRLAEKGVPEATIERTLGHDTSGGRAIANYNLYAYRAEKLRALEVWGAELLGIVGDTQPFDGPNVVPFEQPLARASTN